MSDIPNHCDLCGAPIVEGEVGLCPACAIITVFGFDRPHEKPHEDELLAGKYRIREPLGEGGFGTVYRAEQVAPIERGVAIKIIKPGMDSKEVIVRFEAERQALALLDHPGIAKIFDGGETARGRPFFAMELVEGKAVTVFCSESGLGQRERLELFGRICDAIQHAHQRGIIHRDLKPSNILVTSDGAPKIIDFGIARATSRLLSEQTLLTSFHQFLGTPAYVSPEQAEMSGRDVDTRSDIYSLGALLYELVTGTPAFDSEEFREAGLAEMLRMIRENEPPRPSTRITEKSHPGESRNVRLSVRNELDWVIMRALQKDPERRYSSAFDFARDIRRFLNNEPLEARPPSRIYRVGKFVRRHRAGVAATSITIAALVAGFVFATYGLLRAKTEAEAARLQADRANAVVHLIDEMFGSADPLLTGGANYTVRQLLDDYSREFEGKLDDQPEVELSLQMTIAAAYHGLAEFAEAEAHYRRADELAANIGHSDRHAIQRNIGWTLRHQGRYTEALEALVEVLTIEKDSGMSGIETAAMLVETHRLLGQTEVAISLAKEIRPQTKSSRGLNILALAFADTDDFEMARLLGRQALTLAEKQHSPDDPRLIRPLDTLVVIAELEGDLAEAEKYSSAAVVIARASLPHDHPARLFAEARAAEVELASNSARAAGDMKSITSRLLERVGDKPEVFTPVLKLAGKLFAQGRGDEARKFLMDKLDLDYEALSSGSVVTIDMTGGVVGRIIREGRIKNYIPLMEQSLGVAKSLFGEDGAHTIELKRALGYMYRWDKRFPEAEEIFREAINTNRRVLGEAHGATVDCILNLAETLWDQGRDDDASALLIGDFGGTRNDEETARVLEKLGGYFLNTGRLTIAEELLERSLAIRRRIRGDEHPETVRSLLLLGELEVSHHWCRQIARGPQLLETYELARKIHGDASLEVAGAARMLAADHGLLLGVPETLELIREASTRAEAGGADGATLQIYASCRSGLEQSLLQRNHIRDENLKKWRELEAAGQGGTAAAAFHLTRAAYSEAAIDLSEDARRHLDLGLQIAEGVTDLPVAQRYNDQMIAGWIAWRFGEQQRSEEILLRTIEEQRFNSSVPSSARAELLQSYLRPIWDSGDTTRFWGNIDRIEDEVAGKVWDPSRIEILVPRHSRWFCKSSSEPPVEGWNALRFDREILWGRGQGPCHDYMIPAGKRLPFPMDGSSQTGYFRHSFQVSDPAKFEKLKLRLTRWAGAVVYINGMEVVRHNLADNAVHNELALQPERGGQLRAHVFEIPASSLTPGQNTIAVAVHRYGRKTYLYFDLALEGMLK